MVSQGLDRLPSLGSLLAGGGGSDRGPFTVTLLTVSERIWEGGYFLVFGLRGLFGCQFMSPSFFPSHLLQVQNINLSHLCNTLLAHSQAATGKAFPLEKHRPPGHLKFDNALQSSIPVSHNFLSTWSNLTLYFKSTACMVTMGVFQLLFQ